MATYSTIRYGSRGDDVKTLQSALNDAGYSLNVDGIFGSKTQAAVKQYQKSQGLAVDGIVGKNTWGALTGAPSSSAQTSEYTPSKQLQSLIDKINAQQAYTPKTEEQIRQQAEGEYQSYYDQLRLAAQQQSEKNDLMLAQQREALQKTYDDQREQSEKQYASAYSQSDRQMLSRGMQRSSYGAQTLANLQSQGVQAQQDISDAQASAQSDIDSQRTQLASQLAAQLAQYDAGQAADVLNRIREIEDQEYERTQTSISQKNNLAAQIYQLMYQEQRDAVADAQWKAQMDESKRQFNASKSSSKSSSSSKRTATQTTQSAGTTPGGMSLKDFMNALSGGSTSSTKSSTLSDLLKNIKVKPASSTKQA